MKLPFDLINNLSTSATKVVLFILSSLLTFTAGLLFKRGKAFFENIQTTLDSIRDNHLHSIETNTQNTVEILKEIKEDLKAAKRTAVSIDRLCQRQT